jgi:hypothetical protein
MPRYRQRACLEAGLKLDLNKLMRQGCVAPNARIFWSSVWTNSYTGEETAKAHFTSVMSAQEGRLEIHLNDTLQTIFLAPRRRHFGGHQWYFVCPVRKRCASVLWRPPGAKSFRSRQAWGRSVAYASQFLDPDNRAHRGKAKIKARLIGDCDPEEWELPPKPKWMRWQTYNRYVERFDGYEEILNSGLERLVAIARQKLLDDCARAPARGSFEAFGLMPLRYERAPACANVGPFVGLPSSTAPS